MIVHVSPIIIVVVYEAQYYVARGICILNVYDAAYTRST